MYIKGTSNIQLQSMTNQFALIVAITSFFTVDFLLIAIAKIIAQTSNKR